MVDDGRWDGRLWNGRWDGRLWDSSWSWDDQMVDEINFTILPSHNLSHNLPSSYLILLGGKWEIVITWNGGRRKK